MDIHSPHIALWVISFICVQIICKLFSLKCSIRSIIIALWFFDLLCKKKLQLFLFAYLLSLHINSISSFQCLRDLNLGCELRSFPRIYEEIRLSGSEHSPFLRVKGGLGEETWLAVLWTITLTLACEQECLFNI